MRRRPRNDSGALPLPVWGEGWGEGDTELSRDLNPSPQPSPYGRGSRSSLLRVDDQHRVPAMVKLPLEKERGGAKAAPPLAVSVAASLRQRIRAQLEVHGHGFH